MLRDYLQMLIELFRVADRFLAPLGQVLAIAITLAFLAAAILLVARLLARFGPRTLLARVVLVLLGLPVAVVAVLLVWRLIFHAARHLAGSPWPWSLVF